MASWGNFSFNFVDDTHETETQPQRPRLGHSRLTLSNKRTAKVTIGKDHIAALYQDALLTQKSQAETYGFSKGTAPLQYIEENFRSNIVSHLKELLFTHCVLDVLYSSLFTNKIVVVGDPDLVDIQLKPESEAEFIFSLINVDIETDKRWKSFSLKAPNRKNYKDLDRQVDAFVIDEVERKQAYESFLKKNGAVIDMGDWVFFEIALLDKNKKALMQDYRSHLWIRIQGEEDGQDLHELFLGKKVGESFYTQNPFLQEYMSLSFDMEHTFLVDIKDTIPHAYFSFDLLKHHFGLKEEHEVAAKLVEVFSTRNDISLCRETVEALLKMFNKHYYFSIPEHLLERQQHMVLQAVQNNPDYHVYKAKFDFKEKIKQLAEKQMRESIIIDAIAYQEGITVSHDDVKAYLNLLKRPRTKEFVYFTLPYNIVMGQDLPLSVEIVKRSCLREKTLNYLLTELTHKAKE